MIPASDIYQSRIGARAAIITRPDPVVYTSRNAGRRATLSRQQLFRYRKDGFLLLNNVFTREENNQFVQEARRLAQDDSLRQREEVIIEPNSNEVRSVFRVHRLSALFERLVANVRLVNVARQILGSEVYIHQSRLNLKPGFGGGEFYWHSDFETWHVEDGMPHMRALSCTILLTDNFEFNAPLMLIPGSHKYFVPCVGETPEEHYKQSLKRQEIGTPDETSIKFLADQGGIQALKGVAGSVIFFDCNTMHGSSSNISPYPRNNLFVVYNSVDNLLEPPRGGIAPRPEFIASRVDVSPVIPAEPTSYVIH
jgi:ectoine hydroxylase